MVHKQITQELLPVLYYPRDGNYMLLASAKSKSKGTGNLSVFGRIAKELGFNMELNKYNT